MLCQLILQQAMFGYFHIALLFMSLLGTVMQLPAQARLQATLQPAVISLTETTELRFLLEQTDRIEQFSPPSLGVFQIISGPNTESSMEMINGETRRYVSLSYRLQPKSVGHFHIGEATATVKGQLLRSKPLTLKVMPGNPASPPQSHSLRSLPESAGEMAYNEYLLQPGEDVREKIDRNLFVRVQTDKTSCFVGEPVVATYKLYTRLKSESNIVKSPSFNGFSVIDLQPRGTENQYAIERYNGRDYHVYLLRKVQLYPLQAGKVALEPVAVENNLQFIRAEYLRQSAADLLGGWVPGSLPAEAMVEQQVTVQTAPLAINVQPLPENGRPASFSGAVGKFNLSALIEQDSLNAGDAGTLQLLLTGAGNMTLIPTPEISWPKGVEGFEPSVKEGYNQLTVPVSGSRIFNYPFSAEKAGNYIIPAIEFSYFDPAQGAYKKISTTPLTVYILPGSKKEVIEAPLVSPSRFDGWWIIPVLLLPVLMLLILFNKKKAPLMAAMPPSYPSEPILQATTPLLYRTELLLLQNNPPVFYQTLHQELYQLLSQKLHIPVDTVGIKAVSEALQQKGVPIAEKLAWIELLESISARVYAPHSHPANLQDDFARAMQLARML